jgi:S1-C subfamily serine protease
LHIIASTTTSYELQINHITNVLNLIRENKPIKKADIGISIDLVILGIAKSNYKLKNEISEEISKKIINSGGPPEVMLISTVYPASNANDILMPGDIIYKVNDFIIANDILKFEEQINESLFNNKELSITVSRNSEIKTFKIPKVDNTQDYLIDKYVSFGGAYFHDITKLVKQHLYSDLNGIYLSYNNVGSPFSKVAVSNQVIKIIKY